MKQILGLMLVTFLSSNAAAATAEQRASWQASLNGKNAGAALEAVKMIKTHGNNDPLVIPMLLNAIGRSDAAGSLKVGTAACEALGGITQYPVFPNITCTHVALPEAQKVWRTWHSARKSWTIAKIRTDSSDKRQRLLQSKRVDEALRGLMVSMALGTESSDVHKEVLDRFAGDLKATMAVKDKKTRTFTVTNSGKTPAIYAIDGQSFCDAAAAGTCPPSAAPAYDIAWYLAPGKSKTYTINGTGAAYKVSEKLRDKELLATLSK